ncbi:hypothetical protein MGYG_07381 [Nannizzia gypsea CBS 118893]|uniref:TOM core complex subunit Tom6 n=1 Tax=Arthroderma gypseum (strain ATCC MYA-4604 / CBS 118893) TaxID=535722 RepID=E4V2Z9_ARTGP|nr:hypothetical protein MGYG_07381 [Nannizzia gypsea CBS 118893]EFR04373.1 hypothetical protein MGYG_07381 [Nannizzia gypsea CBS 118893]
MAPKQRVISHPSRGEPRGVVSTVYSELTSSENATVVRSVLIFGAAVAFLQSPFSEWLLPAL